MKIFYRFFFLDGTGHIVRGEGQECTDDLSALDIAQTLAADFAIEIWTGTRRVALIKKGGEALNAQDRQSL